MALPGQDRFLTFLLRLGLRNVDPSTIDIKLVRAQVTADTRQQRWPALPMDWAEQELELFLCWRKLLHHGVLAPVALASCGDEGDRESRRSRTRRGGGTASRAAGSHGRLRGVWKSPSRHARSRSRSGSGRSRTSASSASKETSTAHSPVGPDTRPCDSAPHSTKRTS